MSRPGADLTEWLRYLREIGVRELTPRAASASAASASGAASALSEAREARGVEGPRTSTSEFRPSPLHNLGERGFESSPPPDPAQRLRELREEIGECTRCKLHAGRRQLVFGVGDPRARLMFVGEGPGEQEDLQGEPFVGRAGKKLDEMIAAIGLSRAQVYIANVVKCRPPGNREPEPDEIATCSPFLAAQIEAIRPAVIVTLGGPATKTLLGTREGITRLRGRWQSHRGIPVMPTYHPAYVLRNYTETVRRQVWEDLKAARTRVEGDATR